jgi:hypothetical protein
MVQNNVDDIDFGGGRSSVTAGRLTARSMLDVTVPSVKEHLRTAIGEEHDVLVTGPIIDRERSAEF